MIFERIKDKYYEAKEKGRHIAYICKTQNSPSWFVFFPDSQEWLEARPSDSREQAINRFRQFKKFSLADSSSMRQQSKEYLIEFTALRLVAACRQRDKDLVLAIKEWSSWDWDEAVSRLTIEEVEFISSCV